MVAKQLLMVNPSSLILVGSCCSLKSVLTSAGTLPDGYLKSNSLPQVPTKQSAPTSKIRLPPYLGLPIVIPMLRRIVGPAIAKAQIPW